MAGYAPGNMSGMQKAIQCLLLAMLYCAALPDPSWAKVYITLDDALKEIFPTAERVEKKNLYLSQEEAKKAAGLTKGEIKSRHFAYYEAREKGSVTGYACFVSHVVRTKNAVTMMVFDPDLSVREVRVVAFYEPEEYLPAARWFALFKGKVLTDGLRPGRDIHAISGATMSVNTITQELRRALAVLGTMLKKP